MKFRNVFSPLKSLKTFNSSNFQDLLILLEIFKPLIMSWSLDQTQGFKASGVCLHCANPEIIFVFRFVEKRKKVRGSKKQVSLNFSSFLLFEILIIAMNPSCLCYYQGFSALEKSVACVKQVYNEVSFYF